MSWVILVSQFVVLFALGANLRSWRNFNKIIESGARTSQALSAMINDLMGEMERLRSRIDALERKR